MTFFNSLTDGFKIIIIALCSLALIGEIFFACLCVSRKKAKIISAVQVLISILCAFNIIRLANGGPILPQSAVTSFLNTEMAVIIAIAVNISLGSISLILALTESAKAVVSATDIPKYLEYSHDAVLFAYNNGKIVFLNSKMKELCKALTGGELKNANVFFDAVSKMESSKSVTVYDVNGKSVLRLENGTAWEFSKAQLDDNHYLLTACDTTQVLSVAAEISEKKVLIKETHNQLQWTLDNLDELREQNKISEQNEPIRTQIYQHSQMLYNNVMDGEANGARIDNLDFSIIKNKLSLITYSFALVGVSISVIGNMPTDNVTAPALLDLLSVAASKSVALCGAKQVTMAIYEGGSKLTANISCDGSAAKESPELFVELEDQIKALEGTFAVSYEPTLKFSVMLPK